MGPLLSELADNFDRAAGHWSSWDSVLKLLEFQSWGFFLNTKLNQEESRVGKLRAVNWLLVVVPCVISLVAGWALGFWKENVRPQYQ